MLMVYKLYVITWFPKLLHVHMYVWTILHVESLILEFLSKNCKRVRPLPPPAQNWKWIIFILKFLSIFIVNF